MARYFAELDAKKLVKRVIVADDLDWVLATYGGTWVETADPYADTPGEVAYCGPGYGCDVNSTQKFAPVYQPATTEEKQAATFDKSRLVFDGGTIKTWEQADATKTTATQK